MVVAPEGRRLLRLETRNSQTPIEKKPPWIKARLRTGPEYVALKDLVRREGREAMVRRQVDRTSTRDGPAR